MIPKPKNSREWRDTYVHRLLGLKAAQRVAQLLPLFEQEHPDDQRPREAIKALKDWAADRRPLTMAEVRALSLAAHAAAQVAATPAAKYVARAAGQAVATWHVPTHALAAFEYAGRAAVAQRSKPAPQKQRPTATSCHARQLQRQGRTHPPPNRKKAGRKAAR